MPGPVLRPNGSDTWAWCGFSYPAQEEHPELTDSDRAREGNAAHDFVKGALLGSPPTIGTPASNGWPIDAEMVEGGQMYLAYCRQHMVDASATATIRVETPVTMHRLVHPLNEGTPDFFVADAANRRIVVPDFKYGHRPVDPYRRMQLIDYAAGVCEALDLTAEDVADWEIVLAIIQPRSFHPDGPIREWKLTGAQLFRWITWLSGQAHAAAAGAAPAVTGEHCHDCSARVHCSAFQLAAADGMEFSRDGYAPTLPDAALGLQLYLVRRAQARLKAMATGLEELVKARLRGGAAVSHFGMQSTPGNLQWNDPAEAMVLGAALGADFRKPPMTSTVITPTQAMKDFALPPELVDGYATRKTSIELTELSETSARKAFSHG